MAQSPGSWIFTPATPSVNDDFDLHHFTARGLIARRDGVIEDWVAGAGQLFDYGRCAVSRAQRCSLLRASC